MASDQARELRHQGINAAKSGQKDLARQLLQQSIRIEPRNEASWLWLASVARDSRERHFCLQKILEINPDNEQAQKALRTLEAQMASATAVPEKPSVSDHPQSAAQATTQEMMSQTPGVPIPTRDSVMHALEQIQPIVEEFQQVPPSDANWTKKTKGRAGERDVWILRGYVTAAAVAAMIVLCGAAYLFITSNNIVIGPNGIAFNPTKTPTPTVTLTPTPGSTPTPSMTPRVAPRASATIPPLAPTANVYSPQATDIYPAIFEAPLKNAVNLLESGNPDTALPTLEAERVNTAARFNPNPYYYEALAQAQLGNIEGALQTLEDAEARLEETPNDNYKPLIDAGFAAIYVMEAEAALKSGDRQDAQDFLDQAQERSESAAEGDPRLAAGHLLQARVLSLSGDYEGALEALDVGLAVPDLSYDTNLIIEKARVLMENGDYQEAADVAAFTLYLDPTIERAYQIQAEAALKEDKPGLAVLLLQGYRLYYPGSTVAYRLLGDARAAEGNLDLAVEAYTRALSAEQDPATTLAAYVGRAGVFARQHLYDLALDDFSEALKLGADDTVLFQRMQTAYLAQDYATVLRDSQSLAGSDEVPATEVAALHARALVEQAEAEGSTLTNDDLALVRNSLTSNNAAARATADEYLARARYLRGEYRDALTAIDAAIEDGDTAMRHYVRGLILEAQNERNEAIREFEWVLTWSTLYPFPARADVESRLEDLRR